MANAFSALCRLRSYDNFFSHQSTPRRFVCLSPVILPLPFFHDERSARNSSDRKTRLYVLGSNHVSAPPHAVQWARGVRYSSPAVLTAAILTIDEPMTRQNGFLSAPKYIKKTPPAYFAKVGLKVTRLHQPAEIVVSLQKLSVVTNNDAGDDERCLRSALALMLLPKRGPSRYFAPLLCRSEETFPAPLPCAQPWAHHTSHRWSGVRGR